MRALRASLAALYTYLLELIANAVRATFARPRSSPLSGRSASSFLLFLTGKEKNVSIHVQKAHIVCCEIFCRRTTYNTSRVFFSLTLPFFYLFLRVLCYCICIRACCFHFCFSFLSFPRVAPCDEEQHPVYIHHAVDAFFSGGTYERSKWGIWGFRFIGRTWYMFWTVLCIDDIASDSGVVVLWPQENCSPAVWDIIYYK